MTENPVMVPSLVAWIANEASRPRSLPPIFQLATDPGTPETADTLSAITGVDVEALHVPIEDAYETFREEFTVMCEWFNEVGYSADIPALEARFGFVFTTLETYLRANGRTDKQGMAPVPGWVKAMQ